jgi:polysaccharide deacetylase family protein (PEP-CTERM system associated)
MNILTFDIEDWYNHDDYSRDFAWNKHEVRIYEGTDKILNALAERDLKGTFFCVGWIAEHHPLIIKKIAKAGHHIGCHSYQHELATRMTPQEFRQDTYKAKCLIEDVSGQEVNAFRVPSFSLTKNNLWLFDILVELGFKYDSSVFPAQHEFGGFPGFTINEPFRIAVNGTYIKEYPISIKKILGKEIVYSGGGYFRVIPYFLLKKWTANEKYVLTYFHPSDFDPEQPKMPQLSRMRQFKNRVCLKGAYSKFKRYLFDFNFYNMLDYNEKIDWNKQKIVNSKNFEIIY